MNRDVYRLVLSFLPSVRDYCSLIRVCKFFYENRCKIEDYLEESSDEVNGYKGYFTKFRGTNIKHGKYKRHNNLYITSIKATYEFGNLLCLEYIKSKKCTQRITFRDGMAYPEVPDYGKTNPEPYLIGEKVWDTIRVYSITPLQFYLVYKDNYLSDHFFESRPVLLKAGIEFKEKYGVPFDFIENYVPGAPGCGFRFYDYEYRVSSQWTNHISVPNEFAKCRIFENDMTLYVRIGKNAIYIEHRDRDMNLHGLRKVYNDDRLLYASVYWKGVLDGLHLEYDKEGKPILSHYKNGIKMGL